MQTEIAVEIDQATLTTGPRQGDAVAQAVVVAVAIKKTTTMRWGATCAEARAQPLRRVSRLAPANQQPCRSTSRRFMMFASGGHGRKNL